MRDEHARKRTGTDEAVQERRGRRLQVKHKLFFFGPDELEGEATILDLSTGGCQATCASELQPGTHLKLSMFLQDQPWPLRVDESIVRWVSGPTFGLEFTALRPAQRERLRAMVMKSR